MMDDRRIVKVGAAAGLLVTLLFVPGPHDEPGTVVYRDWEPEAPVTASGSWEPPMWPAVEAGMLQKTTRRERYRVTVGYGERHAWTMEVPAADFAGWPIGAAATVHVFWGWVTGVEHAAPAVAVR
jgi:hypothetical protein